MELIGHRGCAEQYPENTIPAVRASSQYLTTVEVDVRRCATGELVVFHDETVERLTQGEGAVAELSWRELRSLEVLDSGEPVPSLDEMLAAVPEAVTLQVELKEAGLASDVHAAVAASQVDVQISSFLPGALREVAGLDWAVPSGLLFDADPESNVAVAEGLDCEFVHPHFDLCVGTDVVATAQERGFGVIAWKAARTAEDVAALREVGVDGVTVDRWDIA